MTVHPPQQSTIGEEAGGVLGRDGEIERILRCVTREPGTPQTLLLVGEEGIGRTTLLRHVRDRATAEGVLVLSAQGWAEDPRHAHACLHQLLTPPVRDELAALPADRQRALTAVPPADGQVDEAGLHAALTALLDRLAGAGPVLVCVDDADLCGRAFPEALFAAVRQLAGRALTVLLAARHEAALPGPPPGTETLRLGPLSGTAAAALLDRQPTPPTGRHRLEILAEAEGNPLALVELGRGAPGPAKAVRHAPVARVFGVRVDALPAETRRALLYAATAGSGGAVAPVMAALGTGDLAVWAPAEAAGLIALAEDRFDFRHPLARSAAYLGRPAGERQQAHRDLARAAGQPEVRARHLAAATVGANAFVAAALEASAWRRGDAVEAARALEHAARLSPRPTERARRLAEALTAAHAAGDPGWVRELYERLVQEHAEPEFGCAAAGALASALSHESAQREAFELLADASEHFPVVDRSLALALTGLAAGIAAQSGLPEHTAALPALLDRARQADASGRWRPATTGPLARLDTPHTRRALAALVTAVARPRSATGGPSGRGDQRGQGPMHSDLLGRGAMHSDLLGRGAMHSDLLGRGAMHSDLLGRGAMHSDPLGRGAMHSDLLGHRPTHSDPPGRGATHSAPPDPDRATGTPPGPDRQHNTPHDVPPSLGHHRHVRHPAQPGDPAARAVLAAVAHQADEADVDLGQSRTADERLRGARAFGLRGWSVLPLVDTLLATGRFAEAGSVIEDALTQATVLRLPRLRADLETQSLTVRALRGTLPPEPWFTPSVWRVVSLDENRATHARLLRARGLASFTRGDMEDAWRQLRGLFTADGSPLHPFLSARAVAELAVTAQRTGRSAEALPILERVVAEQGDRPSTRMTLLLHHAAALVGPDCEAEQHFQLALVNHGANRWPWECAHVRLNYAIWLRRCRRTLEARQQLTTVLETAERLGAGALAAAAGGELRASGAAPAPADAGLLEQLTAQQQQIVELVARGLSNREIGERLFLSPRTVGSHLYNVYPKLGISSRHQLRDLVQGR
ncbi:AAA family ATPase [Streptomyces sp. NPDC001714]|uniref:helix-turn-helix transcriptional regulator n=1 Tax=Streptomyces sp. NPDC001714 TaxID=3364603 RepID=UPI003674E903